MPTADVEPTQTTPGDPPQVVPSEYNIENITYGEEPEEIEVDKITVPLDNCGGSAVIHQKFSNTQTFVYKYLEDKTYSGGAEISIPVITWAKIVGN